MGKSCISKKRNPKSAKEKATKPIKVVYISNPMKVNTSASEFMALVQKLTGQDSHHGEVSDFSRCEETIEGCVAGEAPLPESEVQVVECSDQKLWGDSFVSEILAEGFNGFSFSSSLFYEEP